MSQSPTALIAGASRGLGLALAEEYLKRGWQVIATARGATRSALDDLAEKAEGRLEIEPLDINESNQVAALHSRLSKRKLDLLFINAGVANDPATTVGQVSTDEFIRVMTTNALSPMRMVESFEGLVPPTGTIGVMSSILGSVSANTQGGWEIYRASKSALNNLMRCFAIRHANDPRAMVLMAPGWVRTDMGGPEADLDIATSIIGVVNTITGRSGTPGLCYLDYQGITLPW